VGSCPAQSPLFASLDVVVEALVTSSSTSITSGWNASSLSSWGLSRPGRIYITSLFRLPM
jgi:hypothetical protein